MPIKVMDKREPEKVLVDDAKMSESAQYRKDHELVKGQFHYREKPGGKLVFPYRKYKCDPNEIWTFIDDEVREIQFMIAVHLSTSGWIETHEYQLDKNGKKKQVVSTPTRRYSFENLDFIPTDSFLHHSLLYEVYVI